MLKLIFTMLFILVISACAQESDLYSASNKDAETQVTAASSGVNAKEKEKTKYLAYVHRMSVELEKDKLAMVHKSVTRACEKDIQFGCTILSADYSSGDYSSGKIKLRVQHEGVAFFSHLASQEGEIATQSREAEDLTLSILDTAKRIDQLERFEKKLIALESRADADIDSLLKVASQLAETQTQLEHLQGSKAVLLQRVQTDILNINLRLKYERSFFKSMGEAFSSFAEELTYAIEGLINAIAYIIPWSLFLTLMFFILRSLFRFLNMKIFRGKTKD